MANITDSLNVDDLGEILSNKSYREFLHAVSNFHTYSRRNILLIYKQMPHATNVASFDSWKNQYNRTIIRDSKSIRILSPVPTEPKKTLIEKIDTTTGSPILDGEGKKIYEDSFLPSSPKFKEVSVFDITQTRGSPVLKLIDGIADNEALSGAFFDSLKIVFAPSTVSDDTAQTLSQTIKNRVEACNLAKNTTFPQIGERLAIESVVYVICLRFGIVPADTSFEYIAENAEEILPHFGEILDTVRAEASKMITALEENFKRLCEERGVNPMTEYAPEAKTAEIKPSAPSVTTPSKIITQKEPQIEPQYNVALRTEKTAFGVDFTHYDVLPVKPVFELATKKSTVQNETPQSLAKPMLAPQIFIPRKQIPPDPLISIADREQYGYTRCQELLPLTKDRAIALFARNMSIYLLHSDNRERMVSVLPEIEAHSGIFGVPHMEWYNSREYLALASGNEEAQKEATFVDTPNAFAVYQIKDGEKDTHTAPYRYQPYSQLAQLSLTVDYPNYSLVYTGTLLPTDNPEKLYMRFNMNKPQGYSGKSMGISDVLSINSDNVITSHYVDEGKYTELMTFIGIEKPGATPGKERDSNEEKTQTESTRATLSATSTAAANGGQNAEGQLSEQPASKPLANGATVPQSQSAPLVDSQILPDIPPPEENNGDDVFAQITAAAEDFSDIDIYAHSLEKAKEHGNVQFYEFGKMINQQCVKDIDRAIKRSKVKDTEGEYRLTKAANTVILKYGRNRIAWVLSVVIKNAAANVFTKENEEWAEEAVNNFGFPEEPPTFEIKTNTVLLNIFIQRFREVQSQKLSYKERISKATKQVRAQTPPQK